ncbi:glutaminase [Microbacterium sp. GXF7504]
MIDDLLAEARSRLAGAPRERLGMLRTPRRILGIARAPRIEPAGDAWHLGVLLLTDDALLATGEIVRAREEARRGFAAESQRERAAVAAAAFRGGFAEGETVHLDWQPIDLDAVARGGASGPVALVDGIPSVRWSAGGGYQPLAGYLRERVELLVSPPQGAT